MTYYIPTPIKESTARKIRNIYNRWMDRLINILFIVGACLLFGIMFSLMGLLLTILVMISQNSHEIDATIATICIVLTNIVGFIILNASSEFIKFSYVPDDDNGKKPQIKTKPL